ncbi:alpha/beta hydrolase [Ornithinimicrobium avium]|uniref:Alpha/beta hydrolase n=1 Tax=Ornithinimicrobium avium TaxID=2283195 RepID=A0A345NNH1_9MICO|nr:alpha/beta hydrolase [Ornithinimicrobium avium]
MLSPEAVELLAAAPVRPERAELSVEENRAAMLEAISSFGPGAQLWSVRDDEVAGRSGAVPVRVYLPAPDPSGVLVFLHGGGWALGDLDTHDALCRDLADGAGCAVVSVDYRQPPERPFPAAVEDVLDVVGALLEDRAGLELDGLPVAVGGDSAGGNLAAVAAQQLRGHPRLLHQVLLVPVTDARPEEWGSYARFGHGPALTRRDMDWYYEQYLPHGTDPDDPLLAPLRAADLSGVAPATFVTAGCDVLRDEGEAYAARLRDAGVPVGVHRAAGMFHTFLLYGDRLAAGREARGYVVERLRQALTG